MVSNDALDVVIGLSKEDAEMMLKDVESCMVFGLETVQMLTGERAQQMVDLIEHKKRLRNAVKKGLVDG